MDSLEIKVTTPGLDESITTVKELKQHISELRDKLITTSYGTTEWDATVQDLTTSVNKLTQVQKAEKDQVSLNEGSYKSIEAKMKELTQVYKTMAVVTEEDRQKQIALAVEINDLNDELKGLDAAIGNHQREVGNYKAAFEGLKGSFEITTEAGQQLASGFSSVAGIIGLSASEASSANSAFSALSGTFSVVSSVTETLGRSTEAMSKAYEIATEFGDVFKKSKDAETKSIKTNTAAEKASTKASKASAAATTAQTAATKTADKATKAFNKTLLANPFTAIIVTVVALIAHLEDIVNVFEKVGQAIGFIKDDTNEFANAAANLTEEFKEQNEELERILTATNASEKERIDETLKLAKAQQEKATATLNAAQARKDELEAEGAWLRFWRGHRKEYKEVTEQTEELTKVEKEATDTVLDLEAKKTGYENKQLEETQKKREEAVKKRIEDAKKVAEEQKKVLDKTTADAKAAFKAISDAWAKTLKDLKTAGPLFDTDKFKSESTNIASILGKSAEEITNLLESTGTYIKGVYHSVYVEAIKEVNDTADARIDTLEKQYEFEKKSLKQEIDDKIVEYQRLNDELAKIEASGGKGTSKYNDKLKELNEAVDDITRLTEKLNTFDETNRQVFDEIKESIKTEAKYTEKELANISDLSKELSDEISSISLYDAATQTGYAYDEILKNAQSYSTELAKNVKSLKSLYDEGILDFEQYTLGLNNAQAEYEEGVEEFNKKYGNLELSNVENLTKEKAEKLKDTYTQAVKHALSIKPKEIADIIADNAAQVAEKAAERSEQVVTKLEAKIRALSMQLTGTVSQSMIEMAAGGTEAAKDLIMESTNALEQEVSKAQTVLGNYLSNLTGFDWDGFFGDSWAKEKELLDARFTAQLEFLNSSIQVYKDALNDPDLSPEMQIQLTEELNSLLLEKQTILNEQSEANAERTAKNIQAIFNGVTAAIGVASDFLNAKMNMHKANADRIMNNEKLNQKEREALLDEEQKAYNKAFKANKAVQYANTVVNTATSAMSAYSAMAGIPYVGPILGAIAAAAAVAAGAFQIKTIAAQQPEDISGGSGAVGTGGTGMGNTINPTIDVNALLNADQASQNLNSDYYTDLQASKAQEQRVYVVESDISETQNTTKTQVMQSSF